MITISSGGNGRLKGGTQNYLFDMSQGNIIVCAKIYENPPRCK